MTEEGEFIEPLGACASTINIGGEGRDGGVVVADDHSIDEKGFINFPYACIQRQKAQLLPPTLSPHWTQQNKWGFPILRKRDHI